MKDPNHNHYKDIDELPRVIEFFMEHGEKRIFERDEFYVREGQKCDLVGYVAEGGFRQIVETSDGQDKIAGYSFEGEFIQIYPVFQIDISPVSIQSIKNSTLFVLTKEEADRHLTWKFRCHFAEITRNDLFARLLVMHRGTPEERYRSLIGHVPNILHEVSLKEIASFLRMTPETLSRIRKKMLTNEHS